MNYNNKDIKFDEFFYIVNYPSYEKELCQMEMKYLFDCVSEKKYLFSNKYINPSRSPSIKHSISIIYSGDSLQYIIDKIVHDRLSFDNFKVCYIKSDDGDVDYEHRLKSVKDIGFVITGFPDLHHPTITLGVSKVRDKWIFGIYEKNDYLWHNHDNKPYSYSNAISTKVARAIVNIAVGNNLDYSLIDPCCGVGTVVIEALDLGLNIKGYEISKSIAFNARENIEFLGYERNIITSGDMHTIKDIFDVAIIDLPYGLFSPTTIEEQTDIIKTARRIAKKLILVTFEDMDNTISNCGFTIIDKCCVAKNRFKRYVVICN